MEALAAGFYIVMEEDRGIAEMYGGELELGETIANGYQHRQQRFNNQHAA